MANVQIPQSARTESAMVGVGAVVSGHHPVASLGLEPSRQAHDGKQSFERM